MNILLILNTFLVLKLEKSNTLIDSHKTENGILKSQLINQTNNNKILEEKNISNEKTIYELKSLNEKIIQNNKIKNDSLNKEITEKEKQIKILTEQIKAKEESIKYFTINDNLEKKFQLNYKVELEQEKNKNKALQKTNRFFICPKPKWKFINVRNRKIKKW